MCNVYWVWAINRVMIVIIMRWRGGDRSQEVRHRDGAHKLIRSNKHHTLAPIVIAAASNNKERLLQPKIIIVNSGLQQV